MSWQSFLDALGKVIVKSLARTVAVAVLMASFGCSAILAAEPSVAVSPQAITSANTPTPDFESLRVKGLNITLPGPQDTIDPDFEGIRSSLASLGIGYSGWSSNSFYNNMLPAERETFGQQAYNGQKPTFFTNNVMLLTYDLSRYGIPDGQIVLGGVYNFDTWAPAGPNALSLATLSYYQTFLNKQVELKVGYLANALEFWGPFLAGNLAASIFGPSASIPVEAGINAPAWTTPAINIKINGPAGFYNKLGIQRASSPDGLFVEKIDNPTGLKWSTPNSGVLAINEFGYLKQAAPGQLATWVRAAPMFNTNRSIDYAFGGRGTGNYAAYFLADQQLVQLAPIASQAARGFYAGVTAMYAPPEFNRFSQYYELRLYGIGLLPSRPGDMLSLVVARNVFSRYLVDAALQGGQLAHDGSLSITAAYTAPIAPGVRAGIGLGYTDHPTPVVYTPQTGSALNILANVITFW
jgi:porin